MLNEQVEANKPLIGDIVWWCDTNRQTIKKGRVAAILIQEVDWETNETRCSVNINPFCFVQKRFDLSINHFELDKINLHFNFEDAKAELLSLLSKKIETVANMRSI